MVIDRMDGFAALGRQFLDRFQRTSRAVVRDGDDADKPQVPDTEIRKETGDKAEISPNAHRLMALREAMESGFKALEAVPDVRPDRIAEARTRLDRGYYNSLEVRSRVAERFDRIARELEDIQEK